jgi:haloalkane dehalogenase
MKRRRGTAAAVLTMVLGLTLPAAPASAGGRAGPSPRLPVASAGLPAAYRAFLDRVGGSRFVTVGGVRMHYVESGARSRPTLLLLHGSPDNVFSWRDVMPGLAEHYHVVAPDLVGFGRSGKPGGPLTWAAEIRYLTLFIEARGLRDVTLVATDIGGIFGSAYATAHPRNVRGLVLWETVTAPIPGYDLLASYCNACVGFFRVPKDPALREQYIVGNPDFAAQVYGGAGLLRPLSGDELAGYSYFLSTRAQRANVADIGASMPIAGVPADNYRIAARYARHLRTSTVPKLVLYGAPGGILPGSTAIGLGTPNTTYVPVGAGIHYLAEDAPAATVAAILAWLAGR